MSVSVGVSVAPKDQENPAAFSTQDCSVWRLLSSLLCYFVLPGHLTDSECNQRLVSKKSSLADRKRSSSRSRRKGDEAQSSGYHSEGKRCYFISNISISFCMFLRSSVCTCISLLVSYICVCICPVFAFFFCLGAVGWVWDFLGGVVFLGVVVVVLVFMFFCGFFSSFILLWGTKGVFCLLLFKVHMKMPQVELLV